MPACAIEGFPEELIKTLPEVSQIKVYWFLRTIIHCNSFALHRAFSKRANQSSEDPNKRSNSLRCGVRILFAGILPNQFSSEIIFKASASKTTGIFSFKILCTISFEF